MLYLELLWLSHFDSHAYVPEIVVAVTSVTDLLYTWNCCGCHTLTAMLVYLELLWLSHVDSHAYIPGIVVAVISVTAMLIYLELLWLSHVDSHAFIPGIVVAVISVTDMLYTWNCCGYHAWDSPKRMGQHRNRLFQHPNS